MEGTGKKPVSGWKFTSEKIQETPLPKFPVHAASWKQTDAGQKSRPIADFSFLTSE